MAFYFESDTGHVCRISAVSFDSTSANFTAGSVDKFANKTYAVQGNIIDRVHMSTFNIDSPLSPYHKSGSNIVTNNSPTEEIYRRAILVMIPFTNSPPLFITSNTSCYIVTEITNYGDKLVFNKDTGFCQYSAFMDGIIKNTNTEDTNSYMLLPYYEYTKGTAQFFYRKERNDCGHLQHQENYYKAYQFRGESIITAQAELMTAYGSADIYLFKYNLITPNTIVSDMTVGETVTYEGRTLRYNFTYESTYDNYDCWFDDTSYDALFDIASFGIYFISDDTKYKPIITGGIVTGYTDDMTVPSDIDDYTSLNHYVPTPSDRETHSEDNIDDMPIGYTSYGNSFTRYYHIDKDTLASLAYDISHSATPNLINNVVSLKSFAVSPSHFIGLTNTEAITIGKATDITTQGDKIQTMLYDYSIGSTTIGGYFGSSSKPHFLDYAPYTRLQLYIPFCDVIELPSHCMYKPIEVYLVGDVTDGSCIGIVKCNGQIVAQKSGVIGTSVAISVNENALRDNAIIGGLLSTAGSSLGVVASGATGNVTGAISGALGIAGSVTNTVIAMNQNYTRVNGVTAGKVNNALPDKCYLMRYRPNKIDTDYYSKTYGIPCDKTMSLSAGDGLTVVDNFRTDFSATQAEKDEIKALFKTGVIL